MRTSFTISLKRSNLIFSYPQAGRPITPSFDVVDGARSPAPKCRRVIVVDESHEEPSTCKLPRSVASASPSSATTSPNHLSDVTHPLPLRILRLPRSLTLPSRYAFPVLNPKRTRLNSSHH